MMKSVHMFVALACVAVGSLPGAVTAQAQADSVPCTADEHRQFDFYLGEWRIMQRISDGADGWHEFPARTSVATAIDGCALIEHWDGEVQFFWTGMSAPAPLKGLSVRAYDPRAEEWRIWWMDSRAPVFSSGFGGGFDGDRGEFFSEPRDGMTSRITFVNESPDSIDWDLAISRDGGESWSVLWTMHMTRAR